MGRGWESEREEREIIARLKMSLCRRVAAQVNPDHECITKVSQMLNHREIHENQPMLKARLK